MDLGHEGVKWSYSEEAWRKNNADNFLTLMDDVTNDVKDFWIKQGKGPAEGHQRQVQYWFEN